MEIHFDYILYDIFELRQPNIYYLDFIAYKEINE